MKPRNKYIIMPEGGKWVETYAYTAEMAYRNEGSWYRSNIRVGVYSCRTGKLYVFKRKLDKDGNVTEVMELTGNEEGLE